MKMLRDNRDARATVELRITTDVEGQCNVLTGFSSMSFWAFWLAIATSCEEGDEKKLRKKLNIGGGDGDEAGRREALWLSTILEVADVGMLLVMAKDLTALGMGRRRRGDAERKARAVVWCIGSRGGRGCVRQLVE